jgi:dTDP-4-amino-4,6-dideoxygalactose transaminase
MLAKEAEIPVTKTFLPPIDDYKALLDEIWASGWLTNNGLCVRQFQIELQSCLQLERSVLCVANGGLALQLSLKAMGVKGNIITTPFSYVATTSCPLWEGCRLSFADIEGDYLSLNPDAVEAAINSDTEAILATHVFGNPCDVEKLQAIAKRYGVALIFDAAHAFGVRYKEHSLLAYGDVSFLSLHATKLVHSVEGGAVVAKDPKVFERVEWMRRFGHDGADAFHGVGINAKMSELHAAMGLCTLRKFDCILDNRRRIAAHYLDTLASVTEDCRAISYRPDSQPNHAYAPFLFKDQTTLLRVIDALKKKNIFPRRYFHPLLTDLTQEASAMTPVAKEISSRILCLPMFDSLSSNQVDIVCSVIIDTLRAGRMKK